MVCLGKSLLLRREGVEVEALHQVTLALAALPSLAGVLQGGTAAVHLMTGVYLLLSVGKWLFLRCGDKGCDRCAQEVNSFFIIMLQNQMSMGYTSHLYTND